mgnify:CR=1 FL=1
MLAGTLAMTITKASEDQSKGNFGGCALLLPNVEGVSATASHCTPLVCVGRKTQCRFMALNALAQLGPHASAAVVRCAASSLGTITIETPPLLQPLYIVHHTAGHRKSCSRYQ